MKQQRELRRRCAPVCFAVVPVIQRDSAGVSRAPCTPEAAGRLRALLAQAEDVAQQNWEALLETRAQLADCQAEASADATDNVSLRHRIRRLRGRVSDQRRVIEGLADADERIAKAQHSAVEALTLVQGGESIGEQVRNVEQALEVARNSASALSIPDVVARCAVESLDKSGQRGSCGRAVMAALCALHAYAIDGARAADFKQWCHNGGNGGVSYSANRVALHESVSVQRSRRLSDARGFPVDPALHRSGRRKMTAHIKLDQGQTATRLYFLDDTSGSTGLVHIGYIGPHLPTGRDPT